VKIRVHLKARPAKKRFQDRQWPPQHRRALGIGLHQRQWHCHSRADTYTAREPVSTKAAANSRNPEAEIDEKMFAFKDEPSSNSR
jgi:hypothetical protein